MLPRDTFPVLRDEGRAPPVTEPDSRLKTSVPARDGTAGDRSGEEAQPVQQALFGLAPPASEPRPGESPALVARTRVRQLWLCIHFPLWPLEALSAEGEDTAEAVFENFKGNRQVLLANARARKLGITPGMPINAALALAPTLKLEERNTSREKRELERLASWAERFTSLVCVEPPDLLLLEIAGSLQLFGNPGTLLGQVQSGLAEQGFGPSIAIAPTVLASTWLARAGRQVVIEDRTKLAGTLAPLPLHCLEWPASVRESLQGMGIYSIGDVLRLPREGFARRFGASRLLQLDRALGHLPDPRKSYRAPERFCEEYELPEEQNDSELLLQVCGQLLSNLERFLTTRQLEVRHVQFSFFHLRKPATHLTVGSVQAGRRKEQWRELLSIRFEQLVLPEPVIAIRLRSGAGQALQANARNLFQGQAPDASITHLLERLSARMGRDAVHGVTIAAEHRPQYAWTATATDAGYPHCAAPGNHWHAHESPLLLADLRRTSSLLLRRPLWMLPEPQALGLDTGGNPTYEGRPLELKEGPERIETGWWDGNGIARDYFIATDSHGIHLWVYLNRTRQSGWYLHGIFG